MALKKPVAPRNLRTAPNWAHSLQTVAPRNLRTAPSWAHTVTPGYRPLPGAATPAPAAPPPQTVAPPDAAYLAEMGGYQQTRDAALGVGGVGGSIAAGRQRGLSQYGYQEGAVDPTTGYGSITFDPNNPFSRASLLKQTYDTNRRSSAQSMGAGGQLYSGATQNAQDLINRGQLGAEDTLQKSLIEFLSANTGERATAGSTYETNAAIAEGNRQGRIPDNPLYSPTASTPDVAQAAAGPTKATASVGRPQKTVGGKRYYQRASDKKWIPL